MIHITQSRDGDGQGLASELGQSVMSGCKDAKTLFSVLIKTVSNRHSINYQIRRWLDVTKETQIFRSFVPIKL